MTRIKCLTEALLADGQREPSTHNIVACCVCGHTFVYRGRQGELNGNFCSMPCQLWYDAGNAPVAAEIFQRRCNGKPMPRTTNGFKIVALTAARTSKARVCAAARANASVHFVSARKTLFSWPRPISSPRPSAAASAVLRLSPPGATGGVYPSLSAFAAINAENG